MFLILLLLVCLPGALSNNLELRTCEPMTVSLCQPLNYNLTYLPNGRGHQTQEDAENELEDFAQLLQTNCTPYLLHFLCAFYVPLCKPYLPPEYEVPPCRELCVHVYQHCYQHYAANQLSWPDHLGCNQFPTKSEMSWCFGPDNPAQLLHTVSTATTPLPTLSINSSSQFKNRSTSMQGPTSTPVVQSTSEDLSPTNTADAIISNSSPHQTHSHSVSPHSHSTSPQPQSSTTPSLSPPVMCQTIPNISFCFDIGYNNIAFPNRQGHTSREEAEHELSKLGFFVLMNCSPKILQYLCLYYLPQCVDYSPYILEPCQELCQEVKNDCSNTLSNYKLYWPNFMDCESLPSKSQGYECSMPITMTTDVRPTIKETTAQGGASIITGSFLFLIISIWFAV